MAEASKALVLGIIMLFLIGGILPLIMSSFSTQTEDYTGYLSPLKNAIQNGFSFHIPVAGSILKVISFGAISGDLTFNPFKIFGENFQTFLLTQVQGFSLIPAVIGVPLLIITFGFLFYGIIKIFPIG